MFLTRQIYNVSVILPLFYHTLYTKVSAVLGFFLHVGSWLWTQGCKPKKKLNTSKTLEYKVRYNKGSITLYDLILVLHCIYALLKQKRVKLQKSPRQQTQHSWSSTMNTFICTLMFICAVVPYNLLSVYWAMVADSGQFHCTWKHCPEYKKKSADDKPTHLCTLVYMHKPHT